MFLTLLKNELVICKIKDIADFNINSNEDFLSVTITQDEISIICEENKAPDNYLCIEKGFKALKIDGILSFSLIGVIAEITAVIAQKGVSVFTVSTYNTDYILIKSVDVKVVVEALKNHGYGVTI